MIEEAHKTETATTAGSPVDPLVMFGVEAVAAFNDAKHDRWELRPECCGQKVAAFDDGAYICDVCQMIYD